MSGLAAAVLQLATASKSVAHVDGVHGTMVLTNAVRCWARCLLIQQGQCLELTCCQLMRT